MIAMMGTPGLQGNYSGSCAVCLKPTDTALAFRGPVELLVGGLMALGIEFDVAKEMVLKNLRERGFVPQFPDAVPTGDQDMTVRVCAACVAACSAPLPAPVLAVMGARIPQITLKDTGTT